MFPTLKLFVPRNRNSKKNCLPLRSSFQSFQSFQVCGGYLRIREISLSGGRMHFPPSCVGPARALCMSFPCSLNAWRPVRPNQSPLCPSSIEPSRPKHPETGRTIALEQPPERGSTRARWQERRLCVCIQVGGGPLQSACGRFSVHPHPSTFNVRSPGRSRNDFWFFVCNAATQQALPFIAGTQILSFFLVVMPPHT